jgi:heptosyltransferase I
MALEQQSSQEPKALNHHTNHNLKDWIATPLSEARNDDYDKHYLCSNYQNGYVVFHMFPGGSLQKLKKWSLNNWFELACKINKEFGYSILITGTKDDLEEANVFCEMLRQNNIDFYNVTGKLSLTETASVLEKSKMLVTVNTGIMHLASALNVALVVINGATSVKRWGPLNKNSISIHTNLDCYPCISLGFESKCKNPECLESITVDRVFKSVRELVVSGEL